MLDDVRDGLLAGAAAALPSALPSTVYALARRRGPLEATLAAGSLVLPNETKRGRLVTAALPVHLVLSLTWGVAFARLGVRGPVAGAAAGLAVAALDLGLVGRRVPRFRALTLAPQLADHAAYGAIVGAVLRSRTARRSP